jgi:phosphoribosylformimino-5-aminoimidazole carboxamide ribotide isomerase
VGRVGGLEGPDLDGIRAFAEVSSAPVVVAGGIRGVDDLRAVAALDGRIEGAVIGRALYEGLDLRAAIGAVA